MTLQKYTAPVTGIGHQLSKDLRSLEACQSYLNDAAMALGLFSAHHQLAATIEEAKKLIDKAIKESARLAVMEEDQLNLFI